MNPTNYIEYHCNEEVDRIISSVSNAINIGLHFIKPIKRMFTVGIILPIYVLSLLVRSKTFVWPLESHKNIVNEIKISSDVDFIRNYIHIECNVNFLRTKYCVRESEELLSKIWIQKDLHQISFAHSIKYNCALYWDCVEKIHNSKLYLIE